MTRFQRKLSWNVDLGGMRLRDPSCDGCLAGRAVVGPGAALAFGEERVALFAFVDNTIEVAPSMVGPMGAVRLGGGPSGGFRIRLHNRAVLLARGALHYFPWQSSGLVWSSDARIRWNFIGPFALDLGATAYIDGAEARTSVMAYY
jgi:hypothetical protein